VIRFSSDRTRKARLGCVAESTRLVAVHRELLVVHINLPSSSMLDLIVRRHGQSLDRVRLVDLRNFLQRLRREY
jgi:hypothetical protein